jgi:cysteine synthase
MNRDRDRVYDEFRAAVGRTPLVEVVEPALAGSNRLLAKLEYTNPSGSHHDRQFWAILREDEEGGRIVPGLTPLIEVSTGCSGVALAYAARRLGYSASVIVPDGIDRARVAAIEAFGARTIAGPPGEGLAGCVRLLRRMLQESRAACADRLAALYCPNHTRREAAVAAGRAIVAEAVGQYLGMESRPPPTHYIGVCGSGTTLLGAVEEAARFGMKAVAWEPLASGIAFDMQQPGHYRRRFGVDPGTVAHSVLGGSQPGVDFPHLARVVTRLHSPIYLVSDGPTEEAIPAARGTLPRWDVPRYYNLPVGRTSLGNVALARHRAVATEGATFLTVFHDPATYYDEVYPCRSS